MTEVILDQETSEAVLSILSDDMADPVRAIVAAGYDKGTFFEGGNWEGVDFSNSDLSGVSFSQAHMRGATVQERFAVAVMQTKPRSSPEFLSTRAPEPSYRDTAQSIPIRTIDSALADPARPTSSFGSNENGDFWGEAQQSKIQEIVGPNRFQSWIEPLSFNDIQDNTLSLTAPTSFLANYVSQNFSDVIVEALRATGTNVQKVIISAPMKGIPSSNIMNLDDAKSEKLKEQSYPRDFIDSNGETALDDRFRFENFVVGKPNELAFSAAKRVAEGSAATYNPLFLYGGVGLGKTHLMHAIAWEIRQKSPHLKAVYLSAEQFMYRFVKALRDRTIMDFKSIFRSVDFLLVDDIQFIAGKDSTQEEFYHCLNSLVDQNKQVIISGDRSPGEIRHLEDRISSRLQSGLVVDLHPTDYELRLGIMQSKLEWFTKNHPEVDIESGVLEFLAHRISSNVRILEGALTRVFAFASQVGKPITLDLTMDCLDDVLRASERKITIEEIQRKVAEHYNVRLADIVGPKRVRSIARPRQIALYLCKMLTSRSLPEIGRRFGNRDHTTVMHGCKRIEELKHQDAVIAEDIELLRRALET